MSDFMNKHVLVTGGSSGIGLGIALGFARAGAKVTITARTPSRIDSAIGQAAEQGLTLRGLTCNVSHAEEVKACVAEAAQQWVVWILSAATRGFSFGAAGRHERTAVG